MPGIVRNAALAGAGFGVAAAVVALVIFDDYATAAVIGVVSGGAFGLFLGAFTRNQAAKFSAQDPTSSGEQLLKHGPANHFRRGEAVGGYLYLTDSRLFFKSHRYNIQDHEQSIPLASIHDVSTCMTGLVIPNGLRIVTENGTERFVVQNRNGWVKAISAMKNTSE